MYLSEILSILYIQLFSTSPDHFICNVHVIFSGYNLREVATHEIGHALGLAHSKVEGAVMHPEHPTHILDFELESDDIEGIQVEKFSSVND